jgi:predicted amidohydrolase
MPELTLTIIQTDLAWENKDMNLEILTKKIRGISERTELVVLPEMFSTGFSMQPEKLAETMEGPTVSWMKLIAAEKNIILTGSLIIRENDDYFNRLVWMLPNGQYGIYDKRHCFSLAGEDEHYTPGNKRLIASVKGWKVNLCICYDLRFPVWTRQNIQPSTETVETPEYDLLVFVANWPERRSIAWRTLLPARAIENQCYVAGVNRTGNDGNGIYHCGDSMIIDPMGEILYHKKDVEDICTITLERNKLEETRLKLPFWKDADPFLII